MPPSAPVTHVIFDFDGLLVDTEPSYTRANTEMLSKYGKEFTMELKRKMMGKKHMDAIKWIIEEVGISDKVTPDEYAKEYDAMLEKMYPLTPALPGAEKLVKHLATKNIPIAICTGSCSRTYGLKETNHQNWTSLIPIKVKTGDDPNVKNGKPHPEPYLYTMSLFSSPPASAASVLVFEDAPNGVDSALGAGMQCVMVPDPAVFKPDETYKARLNKVLTSLEDFVPEEFGLPPFST